MKKNTLLALIAIATAFMLASCDVPNQPAERTFSDCSASGSTDMKTCFAEVLDGISDTQVKDCVAANTNAKTELRDRIGSGSITTSDFKDLDAVAKECAYYFATENGSKSTNSSPIFSNFVSSAAGGFVGNWIYDSMFNSSYRANGGYSSYGSNYQAEKIKTETSSQDKKAKTETVTKKKWDVKAMQDNATTEGSSFFKEVKNTNTKGRDTTGSSSDWSVLGGSSKETKKTSGGTKKTIEAPKKTAPSYTAPKVRSSGGFGTRKRK